MPSLQKCPRMLPRSLKRYVIIRKILFWTIAVIFCVSTPFIILFSLGYSFDPEHKSFIKTSALAIKTEPDGADIFINGKKQPYKSPYTIRYILPRGYTVRIEKKGYYPYETTVSTRSGHVMDCSVILIPDVSKMEMASFPGEVYGYLVYKKYLDVRILCFTDQGIYDSDKTGKDYIVLSRKPLERDEAKTLRGFVEIDDTYFFWNRKIIYKIAPPKPDALPGNREVTRVYTAHDRLRMVKSGIKDRYLIIQDGKEVLAIDNEKSTVVFSLFTLKRRASSAYYDEKDGAFIICDYDDITKQMKLFRKALRTNLLGEIKTFVQEQREDKKTI